MGSKSFYVQQMVILCSGWCSTVEKNETHNWSWSHKTQSGRILYTDNWYTSFKLASDLFKQFKWVFLLEQVLPLRRSLVKIMISHFEVCCVIRVLTLWHGNGQDVQQHQSRGGGNNGQKTGKKHVVFVHTHLEDGGDQTDTTTL